MAVIIKDLGVVTAYAYAVAGGYVGTEEEFETLLGNIAEDLANIENLTVTATTLPAGSEATASYSDGHLTLGIPQGIKGDKGDKGDKGNTGATGNGIASITLTSTSGAVKTYTITFTDGTTTTFDVTDGEVTTESLLETLEEYAKVDGLYEDMTVGNAEQLIASDYVTDKAPYLFRKTGGSTDVGNREYDTLVGASVVWNQLIDNAYNFHSPYTHNGLAFTRNNDGSITVNGTVTGGTNAYCQLSDATRIIANHVYLMTSGSSNQTINMWHNITTGSAKPINIIKPSGAGSGFYLRVNTEGTAVNSVIAQPQVIDLTLLFGTTIADYIYSLEQATAGSGVAWLRQYFPKLFEYHEYDAGTLKSVEGVESHDTVGFNAWDEEWERGSIDNSTGQNTDGNSWFRAKNYMPAIPSTQYCIRGDFDVAHIYYYDANKSFISHEEKNINTTTKTGLITTPTNANYIRFRAWYSTEYTNDICINLSNSGYRNGEYEPYWKRSYPLDSTWVGRGIYKLGSDGKPYADGDIYASDGNGEVRYGVVDLGTLNWNRANTPNNHWRFGATLNEVVKAATTTDVFNGICTKYNSVAPANTYDGVTGLSNNNASNTIFICDENYTDAATFKTAMSGVYLIYELATPTSATYEPFQSPQICDDFGTEEYVTDCLIPIGHETRYPANLRDKVQHLPDLSNLGNGNYIVNQTGMQMSLIPITSIIPSVPTTNGTYKLKCTVSGGQATLTWEVDS